MTEDEIVVETVQYYLEDPRRRASFLRDDVPVCAYETPDGSRRCAVGRCMRLDMPGVNLKSLCGGVDSLEKQLPCLFEEALRPQYRGHSKVFWSSLQNIHDNDNDMVWLSRTSMCRRLRREFPKALEKLQSLGLLPNDS